MTEHHKDKKYKSEWVGGTSCRLPKMTEHIDVKNKFKCELVDERNSERAGGTVQRLPVDDSQRTNSKKNRSKRSRVPTAKPVLLKYDELNVENIQLAGVFNENKVGKTLDVKYFSTSQNKPYKIRIKTPPLLCRFGIDKEGDRKYSTNLSLPGVFNNQKMRDFYEFVKGLDEALKVDGRMRGGCEVFRSPFKDRTKFDPMLRLKLPVRFRKCDFLVYKGDELCTIFEIEKGCKMEVTIELQAMWFIKNKYGYYWNVRRIDIVE